jgi:hypothetical protein
VVRPQQERVQARASNFDGIEGRSLWPTAKRFCCVPSMFDSLGVQVPYTT